MIRSMTGFGRSEYQNGSRKFTVEIKAVNHRYFDINIKMPRRFSLFESAIRNEVKNYVQRGKTDLFITYEDYGEKASELKYNEELAGEYLKYLRRISEKFSITDDVTALTLGKLPEVFSMGELDEDDEELWVMLDETIKGACEQFQASREKEGESLKSDILDKLSKMDANVKSIEERGPEVVEEYRKKLEDKLKELLEDSQFDESRIASEVVIFADKICTDEETVRLHSHIRSMQEALIAGGAVGRKLDFIAQEMNREANTILSKANDLTTSNIAIDLKTDIEKIREQVQNIE